MGILKRERWWGYLNVDGIINVMKYVDDKTIQNYEQLPMVKGIFDPFSAWGYEDAKAKALQKYKEVLYHEKKAH
jgi:hypothetical protein